MLIEAMVERPSPLFLAGRLHFSKTMAKVAVAIQDFGAIRRIEKALSVFSLTGLFLVLKRDGRHFGTPVQLCEVFLPR